MEYCAKDGKPGALLTVTPADPIIVVAPVLLK
jgi:hypothetical protein